MVGREIRRGSYGAREREGLVLFLFLSSFRDVSRVGRCQKRIGCFLSSGACLSLSVSGSSFEERMLRPVLQMNLLCLSICLRALPSEPARDFLGLSCTCRCGAVFKEIHKQSEREASRGGREQEEEEEGGESSNDSKASSSSRSAKSPVPPASQARSSPSSSSASSVGGNKTPPSQSTAAGGKGRRGGEAPDASSSLSSPRERTDQKDPRTASVRRSCQNALCHLFDGDRRADKMLHRAIQRS